MISADRSLRHHLQRRGLQLPGAAGRARSAWATGSAREPTPRSCSTRSRNGAPSARCASTACSRFALWDRKERRCCSRATATASSRSITSRKATRFAFGSEHKAILAHPGFARELDQPALLEYFTFQNIFTDRTLLEGVQLLPAGHYATLEFGRTGAAGSQTRYWDFRFREPRAAGSQRGVPSRSSTACSARR